MLGRYGGRMGWGLAVLLALGSSGCRSGGCPSCNRGLLGQLERARPRAVALLRPRMEKPVPVQTVHAPRPADPQLIMVRAQDSQGVASAWRGLAGAEETQEAPGPVLGSTTNPEVLPVAPRPLPMGQATTPSTPALSPTYEAVHLGQPIVGHHSVQHHAPAVTVAHDDSVPREGAKRALPPYRIEPPDILQIELPLRNRALDQPVTGQHLVRPDGTVHLGIYGQAFVAGLTVEEARQAIFNVLARRIGGRDSLHVLGLDLKREFGINIEVQSNPLRLDELDVDILAYNSKIIYVITDGGGFGEQVYKLPSRGNETVLDAVGDIQGLPAVASKKRVFLARANADPRGAPILYPVDWVGITKGLTATNYQLLPGDRIYVGADPRIKADSNLGKILAPIERVFGAIFLGSATVNSIRNQNNNVR